MTWKGIVKLPVFLLAILILSSTSAFADELSAEKRWQLYQSQKKDPLIAATLSFLVPATGHVYLGEWPRGLGFLAAETGAIIVTIYGSTGERASGGFMGPIGLVGVGILSALKVWEIADAYLLTEPINTSLRKRYKLDVGWRDGNPAVSLRLEY
jgi:hypothetical protein